MELPLLEPVYNKYKDQGFEIVAFDVRKDDKRAKEFITEHNLSYTLLSGGSKEAGAYGIRYVPSSFMVDKDGIVRSNKGAVEKDTIPALEADIEALLK